MHFSDGDFRIFQPGDFLLTGTKRVIPFNQFHSDYAALYPDDEPAPSLAIDVEQEDGETSIHLWDPATGEGE